MKKKTAIAIAVLTTGVLIGSCGLRYMGYHVHAKGDEEFRIDGSTLTAYLGDDTFVSIPDYVTTIGKGAFAKNTTLQSVELPDNLEAIEYNAFGGCTALDDVVLPESVTKVEPGAFQGCTALSVVEIGSQVSSWGSGVFNDCTALKKLILEEENLYLTYYNGALYNGDMTFLYQVLAGREGENYVMPEEVEAIDTYAFWNMQNLKNVMVSENVTEIPSFSMSNMGSVENVVLSSEVSTLDEKAFANNSSLKQVAIYEKTTQIHEKAFTNCQNVKLLVTKESEAENYGKEKKLTVIYKAEYPIDFVDSNVYLEEKPSKTVTITKEQHITTEKNEEVEASDEVSEVIGIYEHPLDVQEEGVIGKTIIAGGNAVVLIGDSDQKIYGKPAGEQKIQEDSEEETTQVEEETSEEETTQVEEEISDKKETEKGTSETQKENESQIIKERQYYKQSSLTEYEISETIEEIGRLSFARSGLTSIEIPDSVETIGYGAFYACEDLKEVTISEAVKTIETKAFADTPWLEQWLNGADTAGDGSDFLIVGDGILLAYRGTESKIEIPDYVKQVGSEAFKGHEELTEVTIPDSVTKINAEAFRNCKNLKSVNGCKGIKTIIRGAFYGTQIDEESLK
ncbi:MAG: leucine-rich repeat domain-containing protein [Lachnospiraceae bacterium]|nr:leucine-rich repeat domain-containing protein [Lachnospiraceae bacterium]